MSQKDEAPDLVSVEGRAKQSQHSQRSPFAHDPLAIAAGCADAEGFLVALRCCLGDGDELHRFITKLSGDRLLGACRHLQKMCIERSAR